MKDLELRPAQSAYLAYGVILGLPIIIFYIASVTNRALWAYIGEGILISALLCIFYWLRVCRLNLTDRTFEYHSIFGKSIILSISEIQSATFEFGYKGGLSFSRGLGNSIHNIVIVGNRAGKNIEIVLPAQIFDGRKAGDFLKQLNKLLGNSD